MVFGVAPDSFTAVFLGTFSQNQTFPCTVHPDPRCRADCAGMNPCVAMLFLHCSVSLFFHRLRLLFWGFSALYSASAFRPAQAANHVLGDNMAEHSRCQAMRGQESLCDLCSTDAALLRLTASVPPQESVRPMA